MLLRKRFFYPKGRFSWRLSTKMCKILIWRMRISQNWVGFLARSNFFLALFLSFFSALLFSLPFALHILSDCLKKLVVNYGYNLETRPRSIIGIMGLFTTIFAPKTDNDFFNLLHRHAIDIQNRQLCELIYPNSVICLSRLLYIELTLFWLAESVQWIQNQRLSRHIAADYTTIMLRTLKVTGNNVMAFCVTCRQWRSKNMTSIFFSFNV